jgi:hypothetical protein
MIRRLIREAIIGATSSGAAGPRQESTEEIKSKTTIVCERHQFHESLQLLNAMRAMGGVRRVARSASCDAGVPVGEIPERIMRHTNFGAINERLNTEAFEDPSVPETSAPPPSWGQYGDALRSETPMSHEDLTMMQATHEQKRAAAENVHKPQNVRTLQDDLFGR